MKKPIKKNACPHCKGTGEDQSSGKRGQPVLICHECLGDGKRKKMEMMVWRYSQFPYVICGVGFMEDNGTAYLPSYMNHFRPIKVLSLKDGKELAVKLDALEQEHKAALETLHEGFVARLRMICPVAAETR